MKVSEQTRFPHPVLSSYTGDFDGCNFEINFKITEVPDTTSLVLDFVVITNESSVFSLIENGKAATGVFVTCLETYFNELIQLNEVAGRVVIPPGRLKGRTRLLPVVWTKEAVDGFTSEKLHPEFRSEEWSFSRGAILAVGDEQIISVGREKLVPMETIFTLGRDDEIPPGETRLQLDGEKIQILAAGKTFERIHNLRGSGSGKTILLNSIYLPAVMGVLNSIGNDSSLFEGRRWYRIFQAKCDHLGIDPASGDILKDAQALLNSPFKRIQDTRELVI